MPLVTFAPILARQRVQSQRAIVGGKLAPGCVGLNYHVDKYPPQEYAPASSYSRGVVAAGRPRGA